MGLDINGIKFLLYTRAFGVDFQATATIGRQGLHLTRAEFKRTLNQFALYPDKAAIRSMFIESGGFGESFFKHLGAKTVESFDVSSYEGSTHIHDLNVHIPAAFKERYSLVFDGGSLEHLFNFPTALKNCMEMVRVGGHYACVTPANNYFGHGFYQFSPEVFFGVFRPENGYELVSVLAFEDEPDAKWFEVKDPKKVQGRVRLINGVPTSMAVLARRVTHSQIYATVSQQSDYMPFWDGSRISNTATPLGLNQSSLRTLARGIKRYLPGFVRNWLRQRINNFRLRNSRFFTPISLHEYSQGLAKKHT